ncbi:MAG: glucosaminidase domain-containing protein [Sphingobacteriales bacterium]|nr:glucosaminidase domain-containing protein [Sphingobacteriales bacterium]
MRFYLPYLLICLTTTFVACAAPFDTEDQDRVRKIQDYVDTYKQIAVEEMYLMGIPASITLAQGLLETNFGDSKLAREANNHFGIKCKTYWKGDTYYTDDDTINECFRKYPSSYDSYIDHSMFLRFHHAHKYDKLFLLQQTDYIGWANGLQQLGYATNQKYAEILIRFISTYQLDRFDSERFLVAEKYKDKSYVVTIKTSKTAPQNSVVIDGSQYSNAIKATQPQNISPQATISPGIATSIGNMSAMPKHNNAQPTPPPFTPPTQNNNAMGNSTGNLQQKPSQQPTEIAMVDNTYQQPENEVLSVQNVLINNCKALVFNRELYPSYIAFKYNLPLDKVYAYNDLPLGTTLKAGIPVFISPKKKLPEPDKQIHIVQTSQTISDIAQLYGVQLKYLCKRNKLKPESELQTGEFIYLQTNKPKNNKKG